jgi:hypothetical protein
MKMKNKVGIVGTILGLIAMTAAFLSPWIMETISPSKPLEEEVVNFAAKLADAAVAKAKGEKYTPQNPPQQDLGSYVPPTVIGLGMTSMILGFVSVIKGEKKVIGGSAIGLGISAAVVQWSIILAAALIFVILVAAVLNAFGIDLDF